MRIKQFFTVAVIIGLLSISLTANAVLSPLKIARLANLSCIHYKVEGICVKHKHGHVIIGTKISMWKPVLVIETVKKPFDSNLPLVGKIGKAANKQLSTEALAKLMKQVPGLSKIKLKSPITSGSVRSSGDEQMQFNEVHIMSFPFSDFTSIVGDVVPMWCGGLEAPFPTIYYMSELDFLNWRQKADMFTLKSLGSQFASAFMVCQLANLGGSLISELKKHNLIKKIPHFKGLGDLCMGWWGPTYPRLGWIANESEVVGSAADAFRGAYWDSDNSQSKVRFLSLPFTPSMDDELQEALPSKSGCIKIGKNPALWEYGKLSPTGKYLWIYWKHFTCCKF